MTTDVGIRPDADRPIKTRVKTTTANRLVRPCAHGRQVWLIGGQLWHQKSDVAGEENLLDPCRGKT